MRVIFYKLNGENTIHYCNLNKKDVFIPISDMWDNLYCPYCAEVINV